MIVIQFIKLIIFFCKVYYFLFVFVFCFSSFVIFCCSCKNIILHKIENKYALCLVCVMVKGTRSIIGINFSFNLFFVICLYVTGILCTQLVLFFRLYYYYIMLWLIMYFVLLEDETILL
jgi:hypothetical protein